MQYRTLGNTGMQVSQLCFGTMSFGGDADEETSIAMFNRCRDAGINFFDCANVYQHGLAEEILGKCIQGIRHELVITSKFRFPMGDGPNQSGASRKHILREIEQTLNRLDTDYLDLYFIHRFDERTPLEETLRALDDLVQAGMILYPAVSNFAAWQIAKALGLSALHGWARFECIQPMYNLLKRQAEVEILPLAQSEKLGVIPYSPMAGGYLSGKYSSSNMPETGRLVSNTMYSTRYGADWMIHAVDAFSAKAREMGVRPASLAVAWVGSHPAVTAPIIGARNLAQLEDSLNSIQVPMTPELRKELSELTPEPPPATDRSEENTSANYTQVLAKK
ncbi:MAG: aldo/keto reductase [Anaerolineae bacterium]|nr:aldo/keto reductase [Anaerolineae bacterium]